MPLLGTEFDMMATEGIGIFMERGNVGVWITATVVNLHTVITRACRAGVEVAKDVIK